MIAVTSLYINAALISLFDVILINTWLASSAAAASVSATEVRQRAALLASDKELKSLHDQLVGAGLISEQEFWQGRQGMLENEMLR